MTAAWKQTNSSVRWPATFASPDQRVEGYRPLFRMTHEAAPPTILVVDDHPANLLAVQAVLEPLGYAIVTAPSGEEALKQAAAQDFVLILMDVQMPGLDGYQTAERLREIERAHDVPVVFLTALSDQPGQVDRGYALGAADFIAKPFDPGVLRGRVRALVSLYMRGRRAERQHSMEIERLKDLFLGAVGHDLRNPLQSIAMAAQLLGRPQCTEALRQSSAHRIQRSAARMNAMIEDILDLTRSQFIGAIPVTLGAMDLGELCRAVVAEFRLSHPTRSLDLDVRGVVTGQWDEGRLTRLLANLVGNAIEHAEGSVWIRVYEEDERAVLAVHNDGKPIPAEILPELFDPFRRGHARGEGLGLGLYIVREIARAHRGVVAVETTATEGTTFTVLLPQQPGRIA